MQATTHDSDELAITANRSYDRMRFSGIGRQSCPEEFGSYVGDETKGKNDDSLSGRGRRFESV